MSVQAIAIHGVGNHEPGDIARAIKHNLADAPLLTAIEVEEFNWDQIVEHSPRHSSRFRDTYWSLGRTAYNISAAARVGIDSGGNRLDRSLGSLQFGLHRLSQWLVAAGIALAVAAPVFELAVFAPSILHGVSTLPLTAFDWLVRSPRAIAYVIAIGALAILVLGALRFLAALSSRPLITSVRSVALLVLQPVLVALSGMFAVGGGSAEILRPFAVGVVWIGSFGYPASLVNGEPLGGGLVILILAGVILALLLLAEVLRRLSTPWFGGVIKVLLDIFRYLGEPDYRERIQAELDLKIDGARARAGGDEPIVLVAHSLGTVIAVDSLANSDAWRRSDSVLLVTMGSPLRRFFLSCFPGVLFPRRIVGIAAAMAGRVGALRWLNVYRPWDFVGTTLGLGRAAAGREMSSGQSWRILTSHSNYWGDSEVLRTISRGVKDLAAVGVSSPSLTPGDSYTLPNPPTRTLQRRVLQRALEIGRWLVPGLVFVSMLGWIAFSVDLREDTVQSEVSVLAERGEETRATVIYQEDNRKSRPDTLTIEFLTAEGPHRVRIQVDDTGVSQGALRRFDHGKLLRECKTWRWWQLRRRPSCRLQEVRVRYMLDDPDYFDLPDFPPKPRSLGVVKWFELLYHSSVLSAFTILPLVLVFSLFLLLLGHPLESVPDRPT